VIDEERRSLKRMRLLFKEETKLAQFSYVSHDITIPDIHSGSPHSISI
jgi:hypothetical protein